MLLKTALQQAKEYLKIHKIPDAAIDAWYLLEYLTGYSRSEFMLKENEELSKEIEEKYQKLLQLRANHIPLQQLTNTQDFMGFPFYVNGHVLIPRQDTERLVETVGAVCKGKSILDLCTGSGCIIISLVLHYKVKFAAAVDISKEALLVAKENGKRLHACVEWLQGDLFHPVKDKFDIIVSNPPYIERDIVDKLMPEVKDHEPRIALDGGIDGLDFYRRIIEESPNYLNESGYLFLEIGYKQAKDIKNLLIKRGYSEIIVTKDYAGLDRVISARYFQPNK